VEFNGDSDQVDVLEVADAVQVDPGHLVGRAGNLMPQAATHDAGRVDDPPAVKSASAPSPRGYRR
jgi:hypothetical protein